jgi:frizzled protein 1/7
MQRRVQQPFVCVPAELEYQLLIGSDQVISDCGAPCYHNITFFDKDEIHFVQTWVVTFSVICILSCVFTLATFVVDRDRFPYPERPIVYLALCFGAVAAVYVVGYAHGEDIACNHAVANRTMNFLTERTIKQVQCDSINLLIDQS